MNPSSQNFKMKNIKLAIAIFGIFYFQFAFGELIVNKQPIICTADSDCPIGFDCRSKSGGGAHCINSTGKTLLFEDKYASSCNLDSDCQKGFSCRSNPGGGASCKKYENESNEPMISDELSKSIAFCKRIGLSEKSAGYKKCLDEAFEMFLVEESKEREKLVLDSLRIEAEKDRIFSERRRIENLENERQKIIQSEVATQNSIRQREEQRRRSEALINLGLGILGAGSPISPQSPGNCFLRNNFTSGLHKTCIYNCPTGTITTTVGVTEFCPMTR
jgi:hypothetical protein